MSKQITNTGEMWVDSTDPTKIRLGFTGGFLERHQSECWHIIPQQGPVRKGMVLLSLETNDGLVPVTAPLDGELESFAPNAINFPEKLSADTVVAIIRPEVPKEKSASDYLKKPVTKKRPSVDPNNQRFVPPDWFAIPLPPQPADDDAFLRVRGADGTVRTVPRDVFEERDAALAQARERVQRARQTDEPRPTVARPRPTRPTRGF